MCLLSIKLLLEMRLSLHVGPYAKLFIYLWMSLRFTCPKYSHYLLTPKSFLGKSPSRTCFEIFFKFKGFFTVG